MKAAFLWIYRRIGQFICFTASIFILGEAYELANMTYAVIGGLVLAAGLALRAMMLAFQRQDNE